LSAIADTIARSARSPVLEELALDGFGIGYRRLLGETVEQNNVEIAPPRDV
jgi:hypothetical protein